MFFEKRKSGLKTENQKEGDLISNIRHWIRVWTNEKPTIERYKNIAKRFSEDKVWCKDVTAKDVSGLKDGAIINVKCRKNGTGMLEDWLIEIIEEIERLHKVSPQNYIFLKLVKDGETIISEQPYRFELTYKEMKAINDRQ